MRFTLRDVERNLPVIFSSKKKPKKKGATRPYDPDDLPFKHRDFTQLPEYFHDGEVR